MPLVPRFYAESDGTSPPRDYIGSLGTGERGKFWARVKVLCERPMGEWPQAWYDKVEDKIWELRFPPHRALYILHEDCLVVLHSFKKKSGKLKEKDKAIARRRRDRYLDAKGS